MWSFLIFADKTYSNEDYFMLRLLSFNILAQNLLEDHSYLYINHNKKALNWKIRKQLLLQEITDAEANVHIYPFFLIT
jgi:protein angel